MSSSIEVPDEKRLQDGIYELSDTIEVLGIGEEWDYGIPDTERVREFIERFPDYVTASAYQTYSIILLSERPAKFSGYKIGSGFNYGSTNLLAGITTKRILILAQND